MKKNEITTLEANQTSRAVCKFCQENPCSCPLQLKEIRIRLEVSEEQHKEALRDYKSNKIVQLARYLPQYKLARYIYLLMGGRQNLLPAVLISTTTAQIIFHLLAPRLLIFPIKLLYADNVEFFDVNKTEIILNLVSLGLSSGYFISEKLNERKIFAFHHREILLGRRKAADNVKNFVQLEQQIVERFTQHLDSKLCFTHSQFKHIKPEMDDSYPSVSATEPLHMITAETKMPSIDSVFAYIKNPAPTSNILLWKTKSKLYGEEFKTFAQKSSCVIL